MTLTEQNQRIDSFFKKSKADSLFLRNYSHFPDPNFFYISGIQKTDILLCVKKNKKPALLASSLDAGNLHPTESFDVLQFNNYKDLTIMLRKRLGRKIGLNFAAYPVKSFQNLQKLLKGRKFLDASGTLEQIRAVKSAFEIQKLKEACRISEMASDYFENFFKQGLTEIEVAEKLKEFFKRMNSESAFEPIVAFAENSRIPHHENSKRRIEGSGILLLDFGAKFEGYCSDISRTYFVGKPKFELSESYKIVYEAKKIAEKHLLPGQKASKVAVEVESFLKKNFHQEMPHALGHGIGLEEHDFPSGFSKKAKWRIEQGQCFAIEPAVYCEDYGIRLEDDCVITQEGAKMLSSSPKELLSL